MATVTGSGLVVKETEKRESRVRRNATTARDPSDHAFTRSSALRSATYDNMVIDPKILTKNPTRIVPDVDGFLPLTKQEIKRDIRDIDINSTFAGIESDNDSDSEEFPLEYRNIGLTPHPRVAPQNTLISKYQRLKEWINKGEKGVQIGRDSVKAARLEIIKAKNDYNNIVNGLERWQFSFEVARNILNKSLQQCKERNKALKSDRKAMYALLVNETNIKKRQITNMKEILEEYSRLEDELVNVVLSYQNMISSVDSEVNQKALANGVVLPITSIEIDDFLDEYVPATQKPVIQVQEKMDVSPVEKETAPVRVTRNTINSQQSDDGVDSDLRVLFSGVEEGLRQAEVGIHDIETFFSEESYQVINKKSGTHDMYNNTGSTGVDAADDYETLLTKLLPTSEYEKSIAKPLLDIGVNNEAKWFNVLETVTNQHKGAKVKRLRTHLGQQYTIPLSSCVRSCTPYNKPLILGPLSQYPDLYLGAFDGNASRIPSGSNNGTVIGGNYADEVEINIINNEVYKKCNLQSAAATATTKINRLRYLNNEYKKQIPAALESLRRAKACHDIVINEDMHESRHIRKELISVGVANNPNIHEPPLSPLPTMASKESVNITAAVQPSGKNKNKNSNVNTVIEASVAVPPPAAVSNESKQMETSNSQEIQDDKNTKNNKKRQRK